jgi:hypothetical protein
VHPDSEPSESRENHTKQTKTNLSHNRADFRIENQKRKGKERESQELDENSKSTLECFSRECFGGFWQIAKAKATIGGGAFSGLIFIYWQDLRVGQPSLF